MEETFEQKTVSATILDAIRVRNWNVEKLSQMSGVSERFIVDLLEEHYSKLPAAPYLHGYILKIADALNLDGEKLWQEFIRDNPVMRSGAKDRLPQNRFARAPINKKVFMIGGIGLLVLVYIFVRGASLLGTPMLSIDNLPDGLIVKTETFTVNGSMSPSDELTINKEVIYPDREGKFSHSLTLQKGFNTIEFSVKTVLGKQALIQKNIFFEAPQEPTQDINTNGTTEESF